MWVNKKIGIKINGTIAIVKIPAGRGSPWLTTNQVVTVQSYNRPPQSSLQPVFEVTTATTLLCSHEWILVLGNRLIFAAICSILHSCHCNLRLFFFFCHFLAFSFSFQPKIKFIWTTVARYGSMIEIKWQVN